MSRSMSSGDSISGLQAQAHARLGVTKPTVSLAARGLEVFDEDGEALGEAFVLSGLELVVAGHPGFGPTLRVDVASLGH
jgi:hypothetical protein